MLKNNLTKLHKPLKLLTNSLLLTFLLSVVLLPAASAGITNVKNRSNVLSAQDAVITTIRHDTSAIPPTSQKELIEQDKQLVEQYKKEAAETSERIIFAKDVVSEIPNESTPSEN